MNILEFVTVLVTGFVSCAEFGSYAFVRPALHGLPARERIILEQGLLKTFGRIMPIGMPLCLVLAIVLAVATPNPLTWAAAAAFAVVIATTLVVNVPINIATGRWDPENPPPDWQQTRGRWAIFQTLRSWLLIVGFISVTAATV
jgi:Domain of unknown function (DUF1772)